MATTTAGYIEKVMPEMLDDKIRLTWVRTGFSIADNTSTIRWTLQFITTEFGAIITANDRDYIVEFDGQRFTGIFNFGRVPDNSTFTIASGEVVIPHYSNGAKSFSYSFNVRVDITFTLGSVTRATASGVDAIEPIPRKATIYRAPDFTDEESPTIEFTNPAGNILSKLEVGISLSNGAYVEIPYKEITKTSTSYTFDFSDYERAFLRERTIGSTRLPLMYYVRSTFPNGEYLLSGMSATMTIVDGHPLFESTTIKDVNSVTTALTGNENIIVVNASRVEVGMTVNYRKEAKSVEEKIICGTKSIKSIVGYFDPVESGTVIFSAKDNRGQISTKTVTAASVIEYKKPTISFIYTQPDATATTLTGTVSGTFWHGSFGLSNNTFNLQYRYRIGNGDYTNWTNLYAIPTEGTYSTGFSIPNMDYRNAYTVQMRVIDSIYTVESSEVNVLVKPVFDWSKSDFNFNVPITMNGETVLRHNASANNTVLSASGGHIYIRPQGSEDTTGETIINPDGSVVFGGEVDLSATMSDYVIETGTASMGTNGTWYWSKWKSGRAECYGVRNFGNMAISTAWGSLYCSAAYTQSLPSGLFKSAPEYVNPVVVGTTQGACEVWRDSSTATDSATQITNIILVRPTSYNAQQVKIGFNVIGRWK